MMQIITGAELTPVQLTLTELHNFTWTSGTLRKLTSSFQFQPHEQLHPLRQTQCAQDYHQRELPQAFIMTKHSFCCDKSMLAATKHLTQQKRVCHEKTFVSANICRDKHTFVMTSILVTTKDVFCHNKHTFVVTKVSLSQQTFLSRQNHACCDKTFLATKYVCHNKSFVVTSILLS